MKKDKKSAKAGLKESILRLQVELMENNGYTDEEIEAHKKEAAEKKQKARR